jgi:hypothetical protein
VGVKKPNIPTFHYSNIPDSEYEANAGGWRTAKLHENRIHHRCHKGP